MLLPLLLFVLLRKSRKLRRGFETVREPFQQARPGYLGYHLPWQPTFDKLPTILGKVLCHGTSREERRQFVRASVRQLSQSIDGGRTRHSSALEAPSSAIVAPRLYPCVCKAAKRAGRIKKTSMTRPAGLLPSCWLATHFVIPLQDVTATKGSRRQEAKSGDTTPL